MIVEETARMAAPNTVEIRTPSHAIMSQWSRNNKIIRNGGFISNAMHLIKAIGHRRELRRQAAATAPKQGRV